MTLSVSETVIMKKSLRMTLGRRGGDAKKIAYTTCHTTPFTALDRLFLLFPLIPSMTLTLPYVQSFHLANSAQCRMTSDGLKEGEDERGEVREHTKKGTKINKRKT